MPKKIIILQTCTDQITILYCIFQLLIKRKLGIGTLLVYRKRAVSYFLIIYKVRGMETSGINNLAQTSVIHKKDFEDN